jgi:ABC-type sugar transport system permease subunit
MLTMDFFNEVLKMLGAQPISWLSDPFWSMAAVVTN